MNYKHNVLAAGLFFVFLVPTSSAAQSLDYLPLSQAELGKQFPLHKVRDFDDKFRTKEGISLSIGPSGADCRVTGDDERTLECSGKDAAGTNWETAFTETPGCASIEIYEADLDKNGFTDAVVMQSTCGNGLAPSMHMITWTFDATGRPVPFEADGYFNSLPNGVDALVDLDNDGRAELIYMNFNDGYWITNVYTCRDSRWKRIDGSYRDRVFPLYTRFTSRPNKKAVSPQAGRHPYAPDLSNDHPLRTGYLKSYEYPVQMGEDVRLIVEDDGGTMTTCTPAYWYDSARVVVDSSSARIITKLGYKKSKTTSELLDDIIRSRLPISLMGQRYPDKCSPELLWAIRKREK